MDPRLNPQFNPTQAPAATMPASQAPTQQQPDQQAPPQPAAQPHPAVPATPSTPAPPAHTPLKAEIVEAIPVHQPGQAQTAPNAVEPVIQLPNSPPPKAEEPHDDLDKILQAVNNRVAAPMQAQAKPKREIAKKIAAKAAKVKPVNSNSKPVGLTVAVVMIALVLSVLAVRAYRQTSSAAPLSNQPGKVGTSYTASGAIQSAGGSLVRPADLDDYSQELQTKLNSLNDSQDFAGQSLSDQVLGL
jgi:hypothetical protein